GGVDIGRHHISRGDVVGPRLAGRIGRRGAARNHFHGLWGSGSSKQKNDEKCKETIPGNFHCASRAPGFWRLPEYTGLPLPGFYIIPAVMFHHALLAL